MFVENKKCCRTVEIRPRKHQVPRGNFIKSKESGREYNKENQEPEEILRFKRLAKSPGLATEKRRKVEENERGEESTDRQEPLKRPAKRLFLFNDQNIRSEEEESPNSSFFEKPKSLEVVVHFNFFSGPRVKRN